MHAWFIYCLLWKVALSCCDLFQRVVLVPQGLHNLDQTHNSNAPAFTVPDMSPTSRVPVFNLDRSTMARTLIQTPFVAK